MSTPSRYGCRNGEELCFVEYLGSIEKQDLDPMRSVGVTKEPGYKTGLLVVSATVKGFKKLWSVLLD